MPTPAIIERVKEVHAGLADTRARDAEIDAIKTQLANVMLQPTHKPHYSALGSRLKTAFAGLRADHPKLAASMESLANELAAVGL